MTDEERELEALAARIRGAFLAARLVRSGGHALPPDLAAHILGVAVRLDTWPTVQVTMS